MTQTKHQRLAVATGDSMLWNYFFIILVIFPRLSNAQSELFQKRFSELLKSGKASELESIDQFNQLVFHNPSNFAKSYVAFSRSLQKDNVDPKLPRVLYSVSFKGHSFNASNSDFSRKPGNRFGYYQNETPPTFIGASPRASELEVMTWNLKKKRYDFFVVENFGPKKTPKLVTPNRSKCLQCHQHGGPIFTSIPWGETTSVQEVAQAVFDTKLSEKEKYLRAFYDIAVRGDSALDFDADVRVTSTLMSLRGLDCSKVCQTRECVEKLKILERKLKISMPKGKLFEYIRSVEGSIPGLVSLKYPTSVLANRNALSKDPKHRNDVLIYDIRKAIKDKAKFKIKGTKDRQFSEFYHNANDVKYMHSYEAHADNGAQDPNSLLAGFTLDETKYVGYFSIDDIRGPGHPAGYRDLTYSQNLQQQIAICVKRLSEKNLPSQDHTKHCKVTNFSGVTESLARKIGEARSKLVKVIDDIKLQRQELKRGELAKQRVSFDRIQVIQLKSDSLDPDGSFKNLRLKKLYKGTRHVGWSRKVFTTPGCTESCKPIEFEIVFNSKGDFLYYNESKNYKFTKFGHTPFLSSDHAALLKTIRSQTLARQYEDDQTGLVDPNSIVDATSGATLKAGDLVVYRGAYTTIEVVNYVSETQRIIREIPGK